jgi:hypothetical protein
MNDEMMMKGGSRKKCKPNIEKMLNVFDLNFSAPEEKAVSRLCASKTRINLQTFDWCCITASGSNGHQLLAA